MSLLDKFNILEEVQNKPPKNFHPPKSTPKKSPKPEKRTLDEIAFGEIANSTEFKRLVYLIWFGKTHRGKSADLERQLTKRKQEITVINEYQRGSNKDFRDVMSELKQVLTERNEKLNIS